MAIRFQIVLLSPNQKFHVCSGTFGNLVALEPYVLSVRGNLNHDIGQPRYVGAAGRGNLNNSPVILKTSQNNPRQRRNSMMWVVG